jgi:excisionase family DNA binding protein
VAEPRLMTVARVAAQLDCHPETIRRAIREGRLACYRMRGCTRISPEHLQAYLDAFECRALDQIPQHLNSVAGGGKSSGGMAASAAASRLERRMRLALAKR